MLTQARADPFEGERRRLTMLAYRMCGSWSDAEDVVQGVAMEWLRTDEQVENPAGWLTRTTVLRSIDALRRRQREAVYVGPWAPEPLVMAVDGDPQAEVVREEALSTAFLMMAENLTPPQRAVVVLRALDYDHSEIAGILHITPAASRQHHVRGMRRLDQVNARDVAHDPGVLVPPPAAPDARVDRQAAQLLSAFLTAARDGDLDALTRLLHTDVEAYNDGGGKIRAARRVLVGVPHVARFAAGVARRHESRIVRPAVVNGMPCAIMILSGIRHVVSIQVRDGRIYRVFDVCNPDKHATLAGFASVAASPA